MKTLLVKKCLVWSWVNSPTRHHSISDREMTIAAAMPIISCLFPGMNYYSISGFSQVFNGYVRPVLKKKFPELIGKPEEEVDPAELVEISEFLPCENYEHDTSKWQKKFKELLG